MPTSNPGGIVRLPLGGGSEMGALLAIVRRLSRARTQAEIMAVVSQGVRTLLQADGASFVLRDGDRCYYAEEDAVSPLWKGRRFPMSACISGWCMTNRRSVAIPDIYQDARIPADAYRPTFVRSLAMAPVGQDEAIGALGAYWAELRQPQPEELERLQAIADAAALALANVQPRQAVSSNRRRARAPAPARKPREPTRNWAPHRFSLQAFVERFRREGLRPSSLEAYAFAVVCVAIATLVRLGVRASGVHGLAIFSTYYPAVLLATLIGGKRSGMLAAALGGLAAYYFFMPPLYEFVSLDASDGLNLAVYGGASGLIVLIIDWYQRAVLRLRHEDARHLTLAREQQHRVQNAVSVVEAIVRQSLRGEPGQARTINQRIRAGLAGIDLGDRDRATDEPIRLRDLLAAELQPYDLERFTLDGEDEGSLTPEAASILALAAHELATNALKYGALSTAEGRVTVAWRILGGRATIRWREAGGPLVQPPQKRGYGSIMLRRLIEAAGGAITMEFQPTGVTAEISLALEPARRR